MDSIELGMDEVDQLLNDEELDINEFNNDSDQD